MRLAATIGGRRCDANAENASNRACERASVQKAYRRLTVIRKRELASKLPAGNLHSVCNRPLGAGGLLLGSERAHPC